MRARVELAWVLALCVAAAWGQAAAPACRVKGDALASRRAALGANLALVNDGNLAARKQAAANDPDTMVLLGDFYFAQHQSDQATQWWNTAAQSGDALGYEALGDHTEDMGARRRAYAAAAQLGDAYGERRYGEMLVRGQGGPRLSLIGREYLIQAAEDGSPEAQVEVGAGYTGIPGTEFVPEFAPIADPGVGNCYLTAAQDQHAVAGDRMLRRAYEAGILKDPRPLPSLADAAAFLEYLSSFDPERQPEVLSQAIGREPNSPNLGRALEERVWLTPLPKPGVMSPPLQLLQAHDPQDATGLYFSLLQDLPTLPAPRFGEPRFNTPELVQRGQKLVQEGTAGLAALDNPALAMGLDQSQLQPRLVMAKKVFAQAAALAPAVAAGQTWVQPENAPDVLADYLYARGGLAALTAIRSAHLTLGVNQSLHGKDPQNWQMEYLAGNKDQFPYSPPTDSSAKDSFDPPNLDPATRELVVTDGNGWLMKNDDGPRQWSPDDAPAKRDPHIPLEFGILNAPAAGDLDGPLVEYARLQQAHQPTPQLMFAGSTELDGHKVFHLVVGDPRNLTLKDKSSDNPPVNFDAYIDAANFHLLRLTWSWIADKDSESLDFSNFAQVDNVLIPQQTVYTLQQGSNTDNASSEQDRVLHLELNPKLDGDIFSMNRDEAKKVKQALEDSAKGDKNN